LLSRPLCADRRFSAGAPSPRHETYPQHKFPSLHTVVERPPMSAPIRNESRAEPPRLDSLIYSRFSLIDLLDVLVERAVTDIPGIDAGSVSMERKTGRHIETRSATSQLVRDLDAVQYEARSGPCVQALGTGAAVEGTFPDGRWEDFSRAATAAGVKAVWSLPLAVESEVRAALNLYSFRDGQPWAGHSADQARSFAEQAGVVLANAAALDSLVKVNEDLRAALESRTLIGQAQGILMARENIGEDDAFDIMRRASQRTNRKLRDIAADIVAGLRTRQT
jgi:GAF domain-containing protein